MTERCLEPQSPIFDVALPPARGPDCGALNERRWRRVESRPGLPGDASGDSEALRRPTATVGISTTAAHRHRSVELSTGALVSANAVSREPQAGGTTTRRGEAQVTLAIRWRRLFQG